MNEIVKKCNWTKQIFPLKTFSEWPAEKNYKLTLESQKKYQKSIEKE